MYKELRQQHLRLHVLQLSTNRLPETLSTLQEFYLEIFIFSSYLTLSEAELKCMEFIITLYFGIR